MRVICVDFDGPINNYQGWRDEGFDVILDEPQTGIREAFVLLRSYGFKIVVHSTRCHYESGLQAIKEYLDHYKIEVDAVCRYKPLADMYVDDRGIHFTDWQSAVRLITDFQHYRTGDEPLSGVKTWERWIEFHPEADVYTRPDPCAVAKKQTQPEENADEHH